MANFDGDNLVVTLDPVVNGVLDVDVIDDLYEQWKDWMLATTNNRKYPFLFRPLGGDPLTSIINAGSYIFLQNQSGWRIKPAENNGTYYMVGNLAVEDTTLPALVPTDGAFTAAILGLQPVTQGVTPSMAAQLEYASFSDAVWCNTLTGTTVDAQDSEGHVAGTLANPVKTTQLAVQIATLRGFDTINYLSNVVLDTGDDLSNFKVYGVDQQLTTITVNDGAITNNTIFNDAHVTGVLDNSTVIQDCVISNIDYINGQIWRCILSAGTITLAGGARAEFYDCYSGEAGLNAPIIDMGGTGQDLIMRNWHGILQIDNKTGNDILCVGGAPAQIRFKSGFTNATNSNVYGTGELIFDVGASIPMTNGFVSTDYIADKVWEEPVADHLTVGTFGEHVGKLLLTFKKFVSG